MLFKALQEKFQSNPLQAALAGSSSLVTEVAVTLSCCRNAASA